MKLTAFLAAALIGLTAVAQPKIVAHRGYWRAPGSAQNSIASWNKADSVKVYGSEMDVWMNADGGLVVNHDQTFKGVNMVTAKFNEATAVILDNGENLPSLDKYLATVAATPGDTRLVLEMKSLPDLKREDEAAAKIVDALKYYHLLDRTDIIAFSINACIAFKKLLPPDVPVYYLDGDLTPRKLKALGLDGADYHYNVIYKNPEWVQQAHDLGLKVNVWTVDKVEDMKKLIDMGVDFITTNEPVLLQEVLDGKK
ncbi:MAG: glycerophosphodiester phosphodiesterase [Muribaculaceae bacterium]|nr:glycerophosphodiester phosphodiesterase [Muribaculaceae bacterium]